MKLPKWIASKKAVINPKNNDKWAAAAALPNENIKQKFLRELVC